MGYEKFITEFLKQLAEEAIKKGLEIRKEHKLMKTFYFNCPKCGKPLYSLSTEGGSCPDCKENLTKLFLVEAALQYCVIIGKTISLTCPKCEHSITVTPDNGAVCLCPECREQLPFKLLYNAHVFPKDNCSLQA